MEGLAPPLPLRLSSYEFLVQTRHHWVTTSFLYTPHLLWYCHKFATYWSHSKKYGNRRTCTEYCQCLSFFLHVRWKVGTWKQSWKFESDSETNNSVCIITDSVESDRYTPWYRCTTPVHVSCFQLLTIDHCHSSLDFVYTSWHINLAIACKPW